jgi:hypothetical protein
MFIVEEPSGGQVRASFIGEGARLNRVRYTGDFWTYAYSRRRRLIPSGMYV